MPETKVPARLVSSETSRGRSAACVRALITLLIRTPVMLG